MGRVRSGALAMALVLLFGGMTTFVQKEQLHPRNRAKLNEDLLYIPNESLLTHFTAGLSGVISDVMWIQTINYAAREFESAEKKFTWIEQMIRSVVRLDPYYEAAYSTGGMILSALGQDDRGLQLLQEGIIQCPDSFDIGLELFSIYTLNRGKAPGATAVMLHYIPLLAENSDEPEYYMEWIGRIGKNQSLEGEARRIWEQLLTTSHDNFVRELAWTQIAILDAEITLNSYNAAATAFQREHGRPPESLSEVEEYGSIDRLQIQEEWGTYYLTNAGGVRNSVVDERIATRTMRDLRSQIARYKKRNGEFPESLSAMGKANGPDLERHPVPGRRWVYRPSTGEIADELAESRNG